MKPHLDISTWKDGAKEFANKILPVYGKTHPIKRISPLNVDGKNLYGLLTFFISKNPNGFFSFSIQGKPLDNMVWWDFILTDGTVIIQVWRTCYILEANIYADELKFDVEEFFNENIKKYKNEINNILATFERHSVFINHYKSYQQCVNYLWNEVDKIEIIPPKIPGGHIVDESEIKAIQESIPKYYEESTKLHTLGKSLILNSAFMCESFINILIRVGAVPIFREYHKILEMYLKITFAERLNALPLFTFLFKDKIDNQKDEILKVKELMVLRNKYVHADETSMHNKIGEVLFDRDFPVFGKHDIPYGFEEIKANFQNPSKEKMVWSYHVANQFLDYIKSLLREDIKDMILYLLDQNPIGFNENRKVYSAIYSNSPFSFYLVKENKGSKTE